MIADIAAERAVLGACMLDVRVVPEVCEHIHSGSFYRGSHGTVFDVIVALAAGGAADPISVRAELERRGNLSEVPDALLVEAPSEAVPTLATAYAHRVAACYERRNLHRRAGELQAWALDPTRDPSASLVAFQELVTDATPATLRFLTAEQLAELPPPAWLVDGHVPVGFTALYGPSGSGKTFVAIDWACSVAAGRAWFGNAVMRGPVVYVAAEGATGLSRRLKSWQDSRMASLQGVRVVPDPVNMLDGRAAASLSQLVKRHRASLVVLDTLARTLHGNENETPEMGAYVSACDRLRTEHDCSVVVVHHTGISDPTRMRGNQALFNACDAVIRVEPDEDKGSVIVSQPPPPGGKAKEAEHFDPWHLRITPSGESAVLDTVGRSRADVMQALRDVLGDGAALTRMELLRAVPGAVTAEIVDDPEGPIVRRKDGGTTARYSLREHAGSYAGEAF